MLNYFINFKTVVYSPFFYSFSSKDKLQEISETCIEANKTLFYDELEKIPHEGEVGDLHRDKICINSVIYLSICL